MHRFSRTGMGSRPNAAPDDPCAAKARLSLGAGTDWAWRPALWQAANLLPDAGAIPSQMPLCEGVTVFHDGRSAAPTARQMPVADAAFALVAEVGSFDGSFLSLVLDLPAVAVQGLQLRHLIRIDAQIAAQKPLKTFARLNIKHGPNVEQVVRAWPEEGMVEFDLAYTKVAEKRIEKMWLDLIFEAPGDNRITLRDVVVSRRPRAAL